MNNNAFTLGVDIGNAKNAQLRGSGNLLSIAPNGEGRYAATCVPTIKTYQGPMLVFDPSGELYTNTAQEQEKLGSTVIKLDPWGLVPDARLGSFNPIDIFDGLGMTLSEGARFIADLIVPYYVYQPRRKELESKDPFWPNMQRRLLVGLIILLAREVQQNEGVLTRIRTILNGDDVVYNLAVKLDNAEKDKLLGNAMDPEARAEISSFLQLTDAIRSGVIAGTNQHFGSFGNLIAQRATDRSSFDVKRWIRGENISIYIIGPPSGITAYDSIYRLWLGSLVTPLLLRSPTQTQPTLVILDINESFELWPGICTAITQKRGCRVWSIVSDIDDIRWAFGDYASTVLNSFSTIQALRPMNHASAQKIGELFGMAGTEVMKMKQTEVLAMIDGNSPVVLARADSIIPAKRTPRIKAAR